MPVRRHLDAFEGFKKDMERNWEERSEREISRGELILNKHHI